MTIQQQYAENGEDLVLFELFDRTRSGVIVDVGAHDGVTASNSYFLELQGWTCVLVEPNPALAEAIRKNRRGIVFECAASSQAGAAVFHLAPDDRLSSLEPDGSYLAKLREDGLTLPQITVQARTLDSILTEAGIGCVDVLSIDVEEHELAALQGLTLARWKPRIVLLENNTGWRDQTVPGWMKAQGYRRFYRTGCNDWYTPESDPRFASLAWLFWSRRFNPEIVLAMRLPPWLRDPIRKLRERLAL